ncbi:MAG: glycosyltransferase, partial [bacterium]
MRVCFIGKYPPIQGGVARDLFWASLSLTVHGHATHIVTNAGEAEEGVRIFNLVGNTALGAGPDEAAGCHPVLHSTTGAESASYFPWAEPFVSKLAALAVSVVERQSCDLICGYYLEPYAVAAHLASLWSGVPFGVRHAGSDVGRLFLDPQHRPTYARVLQAADYVFATPSTLRGFLRLGVDLGRIYTLPQFSLPTRYFHPNATALQIEAVRAVARDTLPRDYYRDVFDQAHRSPFDPTLPTIGIYGKLGESKGSYDLIRALGLLH